MIKNLIIATLVALAISGCQTSPLREASPGALSASSASQDTLTLRVPTDFLPNHQAAWTKLERQMLDSSSHEIVLDWHGNGGDVEIGKVFLEAVRKAQGQGKTVIFRLDGSSYSMHALAACYASRIENQTDLLMFHSEEVDGALVPRSEATILPELQQCVSKGILTSSDIDKIYQKEEVWVRGSQKEYRPDSRLRD
jgi:hypothetical protein